MDHGDSWRRTEWKIQIGHKSINLILSQQCLSIHLTSIHNHTRILPTNTIFIHAITQLLHDVYFEENSHLYQFST